MNTPSASLADSATTAGPAGPASPVAGAAAPSRRTVDAPTRAFHWLFALCFAGAYASGDGESWRLLHVTLGYTMVGLLAFRIVWGVVGPKPARFSAWWGRLQALPGLLRQLRQGQWPATLAQNLAMTLAVVALLGGVAATTASGWLTYDELTGDWMAELHEAFGNALLGVVLAHVALVAGLSLLRRRNLAGPMLTGRVPGRGPDLVRHNAGWLAALMLAAVLGFWAWQWQAAPAGGGGDGASLQAGPAGGQPPLASRAGSARRDGDRRGHPGRHGDDD